MPCGDCCVSHSCVKLNRQGFHVCRHFMSDRIIRELLFTWGDQLIDNRKRLTMDLYCNSVSVGLELLIPARTIWSYFETKRKPYSICVVVLYMANSGPHSCCYGDVVLYMENSGPRSCCYISISGPRSCCYGDVVLSMEISAPRSCYGDVVLWPPLLLLWRRSVVYGDLCPPLLLWRRSAVYGELWPPLLLLWRRSAVYGEPWAPDLLLWRRSAVYGEPWAPDLLLWRRSAVYGEPWAPDLLLWRRSESCTLQ